MTDNIRIRTLKFQGITSYRNSPLINFDDLGFNDLFLIHGGTGSGKSSILDALIFGLYGRSASKSILENGRLRSQYADEKLPTTSEIVFSKGNVFYKVTQRLSIPRTAGAKQTLTTHIFRDSEIGFPRPEKVEGKNVEAILGMDPTQFAQTVILQQGKFSRFLNSTDKEREDLLKSVFNAGIYDKIIETAKNHLAEVKVGKETDEAAQKELLSRLDSQLKKDIFADDLDWQERLEELDEYRSRAATYYYDSGDSLQEILKAFAAQATNLERTISAEAAAKSAAVKTANDVYGEKKTLHERVEKAHLFRKKLDELGDESEKMSELEEANSKAKSALPVLEAATNLEKAHRKTDTDIDSAHKLLESLISDSRTEKDLRTQAEAALKTDLPQLSEHPEDNPLFSFAPILETAATQLQSSNSAISASLKVKQTREKEITELERELKEYQANKESVEKNRDTLPELILAQAIRARESAQLLDDSAQKTLVEASQRTSAIHEAWLHSVSAELASELVEGEPCPICHVPYQSTKAVSLGEVPSTSKSTTKEQFDEALTAQQTALSDAGKAAQRFHEATELVTKLEALGQSEDSDTVKKIRAQVEKEGKTVKKLESTFSQSHQEMDALEKSRKSFDEEITKLENKISGLNGKLAPLRKQLAESEAELAAMLKEEIDDVDANELIKQNNLWISRTKKLREAIRALQLSANIYTEREDILRKTLEKSSFDSVTEAKKWHKVPQVLEKDEKTVSDYKQEVAKLQGYLEGEESPYRGKDQRDREATRQERDKAKTALDEVTRESELVSRKAGSIKEISSNIVDSTKDFTRTHQRLEKEYQEYRVWEELSRLLDGSTTGQRLTTYFLEQRLEQILQVANHNIQVFSSGLHQIETAESEPTLESDDAGATQKPKGRGKSRGLGLMVRNLETNQLNTPGSLSGGEQFYVSLAVALALSQVVKMESGNASLENIFIDEGFDTLDDNRLQEVIDVLKRMNDISESKLTVGIISHKNKLVDEIPTGIKIYREDISDEGEKPQSVSKMEFYGLPAKN